jgi:hypothetical protein
VQGYEVESVRFFHDGALAAGRRGRVPPRGRRPPAGGGGGEGEGGVRQVQGPEAADQRARGRPPQPDDAGGEDRPDVADRAGQRDHRGHRKVLRRSVFVARRRVLLYELAS